MTDKATELWRLAVQQFFAKQPEELESFRAAVLEANRKRLAALLEENKHG